MSEIEVNWEKAKEKLIEAGEQMGKGDFSGLVTLLDQLRIRGTYKIGIAYSASHEHKELLVSDPLLNAKFQSGSFLRERRFDITIKASKGLQDEGGQIVCERIRGFMHITGKNSINILTPKFVLGLEPA
ncbi:MAG: hypothetical protein V1735_03900 [Nanoarchaeota archaeon]